MEVQQKTLENVKNTAPNELIQDKDAFKKELSKQQSTTEKATKKYNSALEQAAELNENLKKAEDKITEAALQQIKTKSEIVEASKKMNEIISQIANLK